MECEALRYVRDEMGLTNVKIMIPFVRTVAEAEGVIALLGRARAAPRRERPVGGDDVRAAVQRACSPTRSSTTSTGSPSAPTT